MHTYNVTVNTTKFFSFFFFLTFQRVFHFHLIFCSVRWEIIPLFSYFSILSILTSLRIFSSALHSLHLPSASPSFSARLLQALSVPLSLFDSDISSITFPYIFMSCTHFGSTKLLNIVLDKYDFTEEVKTVPVFSTMCMNFS